MQLAGPIMTGVSYAYTTLLRLTSVVRMRVCPVHTGAGERRAPSGTDAPPALTESTVEGEAALHRRPVVATGEQIARAPIGNLHHRGWKCESAVMADARRRWAPERDVATELDCDVRGHPGWERALYPKPARPTIGRSPVETFRWILEPEGGMLEGVVYPDGSALDGPTPELCGRDGHSLC